MRIEVWEIQPNPDYDPNEKYSEPEVEEHLCAYEGCMPVIGQSWWFQDYTQDNIPLTEYKVESIGNSIIIATNKYEARAHLQVYVRKVISQ